MEMRPSWTVSAALAISTSLRAAAAGSVKLPGSTNFVRSGGRDRQHREFKSADYLSGAEIVRRANASVTRCFIGIDDIAGHGHNDPDFAWHQ